MHFLFLQCETILPHQVAASLVSVKKTEEEEDPDTANCIIIDLFSAFEPGLVAPYSVSLRCVIKRLGSSQNGPKFEHRRVSKPFLRFSS